jgi:tetratricopeptide (TPR) repeat protein
MDTISRILRPLTLIGALVLCTACVSGPAIITDETTPAELIQRAQEASDKNHYALALEYYQALLDRHSDNIELVCTGEYEIAFIHYKQKKYPQAREELNALLQRYETPGQEPMPLQFKRLSAIVLERITEKEQMTDPITDFFSSFKKDNKSSAVVPQS